VHVVRGDGEYGHTPTNRLKQGAEVQDAVGEISRLLIAAADKDIDFALLQAEFWLYAVRNPQLLDKMATRMRGPRSGLEQLIGTALDRRSAPSGATPQTVATIVAGLFEGLVRQRRLDPGQVPDELFGSALRWLFLGIAADGEKERR
jgi:BetI-type transcriptional repressor, C-terminal